MKTIILFLISLFLTVAPESIDIYFSPNGGAEEATITAIDSADQTIDVAVYYFTNPDLSDALLRAHERGVDIRVLVDNRSPFEKPSILSDSGIAVRTDTVRAIMHHKFAVIDSSLLLTGSFNWTVSADESNSENLMVVRLPEIVDTFEVEFAELWLAGADFSFEPDTGIVYITEYGTKYHREGCVYLKHCKIAITKEEAIEQGYEPCKVCDP